ncbi:MAG: nucleoside deaminase [Candidatus Dadabacteria bacterium]|nr:nucleoside deaminase [Candidatus Dadabacteria bacterium]
MRLALERAREAESEGEVPVGCVVVDEGGEVVGSGHNRTEGAEDATAHGEMEAIREASRALGGWRLTGATLYVTLEPCAMCMGAVVLSRVGRVVFGARDPKSGTVVSKYAIGVNGRLNHTAEVTEGVLEYECSELLTRFFKKLRGVSV